MKTDGFILFWRAVLADSFLPGMALRIFSASLNLGCVGHWWLVGSNVN